MTTRRGSFAMGTGWEDVGWNPPDDLEDDEAPPRRRRGQRPGEGSIGGWVDDNGESVNGYMSPYEVLSGSKAGRALLRKAQLAVCDRADDVEQARWELAELGLIPDPYEPPDTRDATTGRLRSEKRNRDRKKNTATKEEPRG